MNDRGETKKASKEQVALLLGQFGCLTCEWHEGVAPEFARKKPL